jgi:hypothetical protein
MKIPDVLVSNLFPYIPYIFFAIKIYRIFIEAKVRKKMKAGN